MGKVSMNHYHPCYTCENSFLCDGEDCHSDEMCNECAISHELKSHLHLDNHNAIVRQKNDEIYILKEELQRIQRLPHMDKARASAVIMQVAAQLAKMPEHNKAKQLKDAVDRWATYTAKVESERDKLLSLLQLSSDSLQECLQHVDYHGTKADKIRDVLQQIDRRLE